MKELDSQDVARARKIARAWWRSWIDREEFEEAALMGLALAAVRFKPERGEWRPFSYAYIRGALLEHIEVSARHLRMERELKAQLKSHAKLAREPTEDAILRREAVRQVAPKVLSSQEMTVLRLFFWDELKLKCIGKRFGISESRVCQVKAEALAKLRNHLQEET